MLRSAAGKVVWVGRATVFLVGLAVILALVVGVASSALSATGGNFILGKANQAETPTSLVSTLAKAAQSALVVNNKSDGSALDLRVNSNDVAPMKVNSEKVVAKLNSDKVDGKNASFFAQKRSEGWHEVGAPGEPPFNSVGGPLWQNSNDSRQFNTVGFYKDSLGTVHLKGVAQVASGRLIPAGTSCGPPPFGADAHVFVLPQGYRPARWAVLPAIRSEISVGRVDILSSGGVYVCSSTDLPQGQWVSLDGIEFRAAN